MARRTADQNKLNELFHKAWGQAKASPEYDKEVWLQLDRFISPIVGPADYNHADEPRDKGRTR